MFNSSLITRRLMRSKQVFMVASQRQMSSSSSVLLVPLEPQEVQLPFEMRSQDLTNAEIESLQSGFREFNARCSDELKEMNQNRITNIIERGGVEGWDTVKILCN